MASIESKLEAQSSKVHPARFQLSALSFQLRDELGLRVRPALDHCTPNCAEGVHTLTPLWDYQKSGVEVSGNIIISLPLIPGIFPAITVRATYIIFPTRDASILLGPPFGLVARYRGQTHQHKAN